MCVVLCSRRTNGIQKPGTTALTDSTMLARRRYAGCHDYRKLSGEQNMSTVYVPPHKNGTPQCVFFSEVVAG